MCINKNPGLMSNGTSLILLLSAIFHAVQTQGLQTAGVCTGGTEYLSDGDFHCFE